MNIVYGGSFNPVTLGHMEIVKRLKEEFKAENLIILPVGAKNYDKDGLISDTNRYNMLKLAFKDLYICDIEFKSDKFLGTLDTLNKLSKNYNDIHFVVGADNVKTMKYWINIEGILSKYNIIVITRDNIDVLSIIKNDFKDYVSKFKIINLDISTQSSLVRSDVVMYKDMLDCSVFDYIEKNSLYRK